MSGITKAFIKASLIYFAIGSTLGVVILFRPEWMLPLRFPHVHLNLVGAFGMLIFGVAYHILPRFSGRMLWSDRLALFHLWASNLGLLIMILAYPLALVADFPVLRWLAHLGGGLLLLAIYLFVYNIWKTVFSPLEMLMGGPPRGG